MKRFNHLWEQVIDWQNLYLAYQKASKGKRHRDEVAKFSFGLENELFALKEDLVSGRYHCGEYRQFTIYERKKRTISAAPFRDRVVHHALMNILEPLLDAQFIYDSYACRKGKGVHSAVDRYQAYAQRYPYVLKLDISQYFASVQHGVLEQELQRRIKDKPVLALVNAIIDSHPDMHKSGTGLPIGNLTSQVFANLYLDRFDHWLKEQKQMKAYIRYVDDMFILSDDKSQLWQLRDEIADHLNAIGLQLHPAKQNIFRTTERVDVLGYRVTKNQRWIRNDLGYQFLRQYKLMAIQYRREEISWEEINARVQSWIGHVQHADSMGLRKAVLPSVTFIRETGHTAASA